MSVFRYFWRSLHLLCWLMGRFTRPRGPQPFDETQRGEIRLDGIRLDFTKVSLLRLMGQPFSVEPYAFERIKNGRVMIIEILRFKSGVSVYCADQEIESIIGAQSLVRDGYGEFSVGSTVFQVLKATRLFPTITVGYEGNSLVVIWAFNSLGLIVDFGNSPAIVQRIEWSSS